MGLVVGDHGLLDSEMIGPEGRETVVALSFYDWLAALIENDAPKQAAYDEGDGDGEPVGHWPSIRKVLGEDSVSWVKGAGR